MAVPASLARVLRHFLVVLLLAVPAAAQDYPEPLTAFVSDHAEVLDPETEARITQALAGAREDPGAEIAVVTVRARSDHGPHLSIESFANGLFNAWGIGEAARNNGILILVATEDREMRIELGAGHPRSWDFVAEEIVHRIMLPAFREGDMARGIEDGTLAAIERIARPFAAGLPAPERTFRAWLREWWPPVAFFGLLGGIFGAAGLAIWRAEHPVCPHCGRRKTVVARKTTVPATRETPGTAEETITCRACDTRTRRIHPVPWASPSRRESGGSSSGFGGGSSSGGGASGRW
jgi:uncharacterized protein